MASKRRTLTIPAVKAARYVGEERRGKGGGSYWPRCVLWDADVPGFGLRIYPSGRKAFIVLYTAGRSKRSMVLGDYPGLSLSDARSLARSYKEEARQGGDPLADRQQDKQAATVAELAADFLDRHAAKKSASTFENYERTLRLHALPKLGRLPVADVTGSDIARLHHGMRHSPTQANRTLATLSKMFACALSWGMRPRAEGNPCQGVDRYPEAKLERFLTADELLRLGQALAETDVHPSAVLAVRLLTLTGCRRNEILELRWSDVDTARGALRIRRSKTGAKELPLAAPVAEILAEAVRQEDSEWVCWGRSPETHYSAGALHRSWKRLLLQAGIDEDVRLHDLRHTVASWAVGEGMSLPLIAGILGQSQLATTQRYAHLDLNPKRHAAERVASAIEAAMRGEGGTVVPMSRASRP